MQIHYYYYYYVEHAKHLSWLLLMQRIRSSSVYILLSHCCIQNLPFSVCDSVASFIYAEVGVKKES